MKKTWLNLIADPADGNGVELLEKIEKGVTSLRGEVDKLKALTPAEEILKDQSRWPAELKKAMEDIQKLMKSANGLDSEVKTMERHFKRVEALAKAEARGSFGDPIARFCADEEKRNYLNALARKLAFPRMALPEHLEKALTGVDSGLGQALIPTEYIPELYDILERYGSYNTLRVDRGLSARTNSYPIMSARPTAVWIGAGSGAAEGTAITPGDFSGTSVSLAIQTAAAYLLASREQLADSTVDMSSTILREMGESIAYLLDFMAFSANAGADQVDAGYYGIFETATVHTGCIAEAAAGNVSVATLDLDDFVKCLTTVSSRVLASSPRWWMHPQILAKVALIRDENGRPIFQNALEAPSSTVGSILGAPVVSVPAAPSTDDASSKIAVYGDPQAYVVGIRQDIELATSEHIKFAENQIAFRALIRAGGKHRIPASNPAGFKPMVVLTTPGA
jgi:HK97 family phage major capsid protein